MQDDLTFKRKYRKRKNPSGGSQTSTVQTSSGADPAGEDGDADGKKEQENKDEEIVKLN